jgi:hypothetical protein
MLACQPRMPRLAASAKQFDFEFAPPLVSAGGD